MYAQANENVRPLHMGNLVNKSPVVRVPAPNTTMARQNLSQERLQVNLLMIQRSELG